MLMILSPAKTLDFDVPRPSLPCSKPRFASEAAELVAQLRHIDAAGLASLMHISPDLAGLNHERFQDWGSRAALKRAQAALLAFKGDVYIGLRAETFSEQQMQFAQQHLRILSGLYGVLRPLDLILPYRLEMGTPLATARGRNLYDFWDARIADALQQQVRASGAAALVNLASQEYFRAVRVAGLKVPVITPQFKERRAGQLKIISFSAKRARGMMAGFAIRNSLREAEQLKSFDEDGYRYDAELSTPHEWLFVR
jgi:uncharacterized protein